MTTEEKIEELRKSQRAIIRGFCALLRSPNPQIVTNAFKDEFSKKLAGELDKLHDSLNEEHFQ